MSDALWGKLIEAIPAVAWVVFATVVYLTVRRPVLRHLLPRISMVRGMGVELTLAGELLDKASEATGSSDTPTPPAAVPPVTTSPVTASDRRGVLRRLDHAAPYLKGGRILWVDDMPENNRYLTRLFEHYGMIVDSVRSTDEALRMVSRHPYDIVLSDIRRGEDDRAGISMLRSFKDHGVTLPVVIHTGQFDPRLGVDPMVFAGTNRVDDVVHYVIDLMERIGLSGPPTT